MFINLFSLEFYSFYFYFGFVLKFGSEIIHSEDVLSSMAGFLSRICGKIKGWIQWSWSYLWAVWFLLVVFVVYILRGPLKLSENISYGMLFLVRV